MMQSQQERRGTQSERDQEVEKGFDLNHLVEKIEDDQLVLNELQDKDLILFLGTTNAGKTTTICFLGERGEGLRIKQDIFLDPDGFEMLGDEIIDTTVPDEEFRIGHNYQSTTATIHVCDLPQRNMKLVDSCGFQDTEGCTVDIANAITLRNAMRFNHSLRPVIVIDANILGLDKGVPFSQFLKLLMRFFSPINEFLPSLSFLFTHVRPDVSNDYIKRTLAKLSSAPHVNKDPDLKDFVKCLYTYFVNHSNCCVLQSEDIASPSAGHVATRRSETLELILQSVPLSQELTSNLGCPLSSEAQTIIKERCQDRRIEIFRHLNCHCYSAVLKPFRQLEVLHASLNLDFVTEIAQDCQSRISSHLKSLFENADSNLAARQYPLLAENLSRCFEAKCLQRVFDVSRDLQTRKLALNKLLREISEVIIAKEQTPFQSSDCDLLGQLQDIKNHLTFFLPDTRSQLQGYNPILEHIKRLLGEAGNRSISILKSLESYLAGDEKLGASFPELPPPNLSHLPPPPPPSDEERTNSSSVIYPHLLILFDDLAFLKSAHLLESHVGPQLTVLYTNSLTRLMAVLETAHALIVGENGFISNIIHLTWSPALSDQMTELYDFLKICYSVGADDHVDGKLSSLHTKLLNGVEGALRDYLPLIDDCLVNQRYGEMVSPFKVMTMVTLDDDTYRSFQVSCVKKKIVSVQESVKKISTEASQMLSLLVEKDCAECVEYEILSTSLTRLRDACSLDFLYSTHGSDSPLDPPTSLLVTLVSMSEGDWSHRVSLFLEALSGLHSPQLTSLFLRLDCMEPLWNFLSDMNEVVLNISSRLELQSTSFLVEPKITTDEALDQLLRCDIFLELSSHYSASRLFRRYLANAVDWSKKQRGALTNWKELTVHHLQARLDSAKASLKAAIQKRDARAVDNELNFLLQHRCLDPYLHPTASEIYNDARNSVKFELLNLAQSGARALSRGDLDKSNSVLQFLEGSTIYGTHIEGVDFPSMVGSLLSENRQALEKLPEEISSLLEKRKFQNILSKLSIVHREDPCTYEECDSLISQHFRKLFDSLTFQSKDLALAPLIEFSFDLLSILKDASVLSKEISYDLRDPLGRIVDLLQLHFKTMLSRITKYLKSYKFEQASELFDQLTSFKSLDRCLSDLLEVGIFEKMGMFQTQIDQFAKRWITPLPEKLILECHSYLSLESPSVFLDEGQDQCQDQDKDCDLMSMSMNIPELNRLMKGVDTAADEILFQEMIDFSSLKKGLLGILSERFHKFLAQIKVAISRYQLGLAEILISETNSFLPCYQSLDIHRHSEFSRLLKNQEQALQCALSVMSRSRATVLGIETIEGISSELKRLQSDRFDQYIDLYRQYSDSLRVEIAKCQPLLVPSFEFISGSSFLDLILAVRVIQKYSLLILDSMLDIQLHHSCTEIISKFEPFVSKYLEVLTHEPKLDNLQEVQQIISEFQDLLSQLVREQLINEACERKWSQYTNHFIEWVTGMCTQLNEDLQELLRYDLFLSKDSDLLIKKCQILINQIQFQLPVSEALFDKLSSANGRFIEYFTKGEFATAAEGFRCVIRLKSLSKLERICTELSQAFHQFLLNHATTLFETLKTELMAKSFKTTDKLIQDVSSIEDNFRSLVDRKSFPNLMDEVRSLFQKELDAIAKRSEYGLSLEEHAENVISMKSFVSDISDREIEKLADRSIGEYFTRQSSMDFYQLGIILAQSGPIGEQLTEGYSQFKSLLTKRFNEATAGISISHALTELSRLNPEISQRQISRLTEAHRNFTSEFEKSLHSYFPGYSSFKPLPLDEFVEKIQRRAASCISPTAIDYVELLAQVFALWAINSSQSSHNEIFDRALLIKPHPVQLIAIFRLLGVDRVSSWWSSLSNLFTESGNSVPGHLIQVGTGEGKSILLGGLAAVLSLLGYEVYCASYSEHLSERDYEAFESLFEMLGVDSRTHYSTLGGLAEDLINFQGDIRKATKNFLFSTNASTAPSNRRTEKRILLLDEVDVFFSPEFFGRTYNPLTTYYSSDTKAIIQHIWDNRQAGLDLATIQALPAYNNLVSACNPVAIPLLEREISAMLRDVNQFSTPPYELVTRTDGRMEIGYKKLDSVSFSTSYGYKKAFAYLHEASQHPIDLSSHTAAFSLSIGCGNFSYSELPKWAFKGIIGVTGTLSSLSPAERNIIADEYNLKTYTYTPSMYGESKLTFKKDSHVIMETDLTRYHQTILKDIVDQSQLGRPVIVYFESEEKLNEFRSSEYGQRLQDVNIVTEKTANLPFYVAKATEAGKVTLFPRVFGRGLDFISRDTAVDAAGGVHVIQTFFSEFQSEEIQIRGRTARQSKRGSYKLILLSSDLEMGLGLKLAEVNRLYEGSSFYNTLETKRNEKVARRVERLLQKEQQSKEVHRISLEFRNMILNSAPSTPQEILNHLLSF